MKTTIIVPVYNAEKTINRCLDSIKKQTIENFECIVVDDGSSDCSPQVCDSYSKNDSRFVVFHKENGGVSSARNFGIDHAKGEWICFVDADDFISEDYLKKIEEKKIISDSIFWGYRVKKKKFVHAILGNSLDEAITAMRGNFAFLRPVWNTSFKLSVLNSEKIRFSTNMHLGEDYLFVLQYLVSCPTRISLIPDSLYNYCVDDSSLSRKHYCISVLMAWQYAFLKYLKMLPISARNKTLLLQDRYRITMMDVYLADQLECFEERKKMLMLMKKERMIKSVIVADVKGVIMHWVKKTKNFLIGTLRK